MGHGPFALGMLGAATMIVGKQQDVHALGLDPESTPEAYADLVERHLGPDPREDTLLLVDMLGGTPANTAVLLCQKCGVQAVAGINLPLLMELIMLRSEFGPGALVELAVGAAPATIVSLSALVDRAQDTGHFGGVE
ncbi:MAG: hypothetical protein AB1445_15420 [Bacillota bacterium]